MHAQAEGLPHLCVWWCPCPVSQDPQRDCGSDGLAPSAPGCEASPPAAEREPTVSTSAHSFTFLHYGSGYHVLSVAMAFPIQGIFKSI